MNTYLAMRQDWEDQYVNALYYLESREFERDRVFRVAYFKSEGKSEKAKELDCKDNPAVQLAELGLIEAKTAVTRAKLRLEGCTLAHHSFKKVLDKLSEDMFLRQ